MTINITLLVTIQIASKGSKIFHELDKLYIKLIIVIFNEMRRGSVAK